MDPNPRMVTIAGQIDWRRLGLQYLVLAIIVATASPSLAAPSGPHRNRGGMDENKNQAEFLGQYPILVSSRAFLTKTQTGRLAT